MPLWQIYHPPGTFTTPESKQALVDSIVPLYTGTDGAGLPAFYVITHFHELPASTTFMGTTPDTSLTKPFIRVVITHIAVRMPDDQQYHRSFTSKVDNALKPHIEDKGYDWEYHIAETGRDLWKINGLIPPPWKSEEERVWARENRAMEYSGARS